MEFGIKRMIFGLKQAAFVFWKELLLAFNLKGIKRIEADPCLHFKNIEPGLVMWVSWVDECVLVGKKMKCKCTRKR